MNDPFDELSNKSNQSDMGRAALVHLCVRELPRPGKPDELLDRFGISAPHIARAARELLGR